MGVRSRMHKYFRLQVGDGWAKTVRNEAREQQSQQARIYWFEQLSILLRLVVSNQSRLLTEKCQMHPSGRTVLHQARKPCISAFFLRGTHRNGGVLVRAKPVQVSCSDHLGRMLGR